MTRADRIAGVILGQAAGDALGSPYEYRQPPALGTADFGPGTFGHPAGSWTDDTEQAVIVARARSEPLAVAAGLLEWYAAGPVDVGTTTSAALSGAHGDPAALAASARRAARGRNPRLVANGSLMRTGPVCLPHLGDEAAIARAARRISALTHASPWAADACMLWSLAIARAVQAGEVDVAAGLHHVPASRREPWRAIITAALAGQPGDFTGNGGCLAAFQAALSAVVHADTLEQGLHLAVSAWGDTDTTGAIAGALLGARFGASAVPERWRKRLHGWPGLDADALESLALEAAGETG